MTNIKRITRIFSGPYIDLGEDLNVFVPEEKGSRDSIASSLFVDDTIKSADVAIQEARRKVAPFWIHSEPLIAAYVDDSGDSFLFFISEEVKNRIVLLQFMDFTNPLCIRAVPYIKEWLRRYEGAGFTVICVHATPLPFGSDVGLVAQTAHRFGLHNPFLVDHDFAMWRALENRYWPRSILFNHNQQIIFDQTGAWGFQRLETEIQKALREISPGLPCPRLMTSVHPRDESDEGLPVPTPAAYFGTKRGKFGNTEQFSTSGTDTIFTIPPGTKLQEGLPYLTGPWQITPHSVYPSSFAYHKGQYQGDCAIRVKFRGSSAHVVISSRNYNQADITSKFRAQVTIDGKPVKDNQRGADVKVEEQKKTFLHIVEPKLFEIMKTPQPGEHELVLSFDQGTADNIDVYAIYFTS